MDAWEKIVPSFRYDKEVPFFDMLVPTVDTVRYGYILEKLLSVRHSVLYTGGTGVGKVGSANTTHVAIPWSRVFLSSKEGP